MNEGWTKDDSRSQSVYIAQAYCIMLKGQWDNGLLFYNVAGRNMASATGLIHKAGRTLAREKKEMDIITAGGEPLRGLINRRIAERNIWNNGSYVNH